MFTTKRYYTLAGVTVGVRDSATGALTYLLGDQLGSTTVSVNAAGGTPVVQRYLPYGAPRSTTGGSAVTDRGWIGQTKDASTGLQYLNARYYDPIIGRFAAVDPIVSGVGSLDRFGYGLDNPVTLKDPTGLKVCDDPRECKALNVNPSGRPLGGGGNSEAQALSSGARKKIASAFRAAVPGSDEVGGIELFLGWEISSGRISGSAWWRAVNGRLMLDMQAATEAILDRGVMRASSSSPTVQAWIAYAQGASQGASKQTQRDAYWLAHQLSLHEGIRSSGMLLQAESADEQAFIETVVENVDLTALSGIRPDGFVAQKLMGGFLNGAPGPLSWFLPAFYPDSYPAGPNSAVDGSIIGLFAGDQHEANVMQGLTGVDSPLFTPG